MGLALAETARAKVNLTLRVLGRRTDGYHTLESLVVFADLADTLTLEKAAKNSLTVRGPFAGACGPAADNLVLKAAQSLPGLEGGHFTLDKRIPAAAGLGGGSSDAAAALRLLARANGISEKEPGLLAVARKLGADVPVCLVPDAKIMRGVGEQLSAPLDLAGLAAVLVNPGVAVPTREVFAAFQPSDGGARALNEPPSGHEALLEWLSGYGNDLTRAAIALVPVISNVLGAIAAQPDCRLHRMSGSGATCFGIFNSPHTANAAAQALRKAQPGWWVAPVTLG